MNTDSDKLTEQSPPSGGGVRWMRDSLIWLPSCLFLGLLIARAAVDAQFYFAPLLVFPLLIGVLLGALLVLLMRMAQIGHRPTIIGGTLLAAGMAVLGIHFFTYLDATAENSARLEQHGAPCLKRNRGEFPSREVFPSI